MLILFITALHYNIVQNPYVIQQHYSLVYCRLVKRKTGAQQLYCCIVLYSKVWSKTKLTWQCSSRWCEVIKSIWSSRFFSVFAFTRDPSKISDDLVHNLCPRLNGTWFNKCIYSRAAAVRWLTAQLSYHAQLELWLVAGLRPAPQRREGTSHIWPSYSGKRKQFVEKQYCGFIIYTNIFKTTPKAHPLPHLA